MDSPDISDSLIEDKAAVTFGVDKLNVFQCLRIFWTEKINLRKRIAFTMILLSILATVFLGMVIFEISKKTIERNYQSAHLHNLQVSSEMMDVYLQEIIEQGRTLLENNGFVHIMKSETGKNGYFSSRHQLAIDSDIGGIVAHNPLINGMMVVNENGNWRYYAKSKTYSGYLDHYYTTDKFLDEDWVKVAREAKGKEVFYSYDVLLGDKAKDCFCYVKNMINPFTQKSFGFLVVSIDKKIWEESFGEDNEGFETNRYMVLLPQKMKGKSRVVYFIGPKEERNKIVNAYYDKDDSVYLCSSYENSVTQWSILNVITKEELEKDSDNIRNIIMILILILVVISINAAAAISSYITKPLDKLAGTISEVEVGNLKVETEFDNSEVGIIGNRFKSLVNNNLELRDRLLNLEIKEKDAQLLLLQSQINPHFLYNTLDSLYFMALIEQADDIADMVQALSNIFKLSLNKGDKFITLRDEIDHMKDYLKILNIRFANRFTLHTDVNDSIMDIKILTFILQPILENAIYHGLESKTGPGNVYLNAGCEGNKLHLSIRDDGIGIEDMSRIEQGYGIQNIKERLYLHYGEESSIQVVSKPNNGTMVTIVIPFGKEGEHVSISSD